jgi:predicted RecB family endonuclease
MNDIDTMFETPTDDTVTQTVAHLAESIALDDDKLDELKAAAKDLEESVKARKRELAMLLISSGMDSVKLANGLSPRAKTIRRYYKAAGVTDEQLYAWLETNDLGGIIKPAVHFQTLQSTLAQYEEQNHEVPTDLFNVSDEPTVVLYGKSKYLNSKEQRS